MGNNRQGYKAQGKALPTMGTDSLILRLAQEAQAKDAKAMPLKRDAIQHHTYAKVEYKRSIYGNIKG